MNFFTPDSIKVDRYWPLCWCTYRSHLLTRTLILELLTDLPMNSGPAELLWKWGGGGGLNSDSKWGGGAENIFFSVTL